MNTFFYGLYSLGHTISDIQEMVADAVNALVKYFYREKEVVMF